MTLIDLLTKSFLSYYDKLEFKIFVLPSIFMKRWLIYYLSKPTPPNLRVFIYFVFVCIPYPKLCWFFSTSKCRRLLLYHRQPCSLLQISNTWSPSQAELQDTDRKHKSSLKEKPELLFKLWIIFNLSLYLIFTFTV